MNYVVAIGISLWRYLVALVKRVFQVHDCNIGIIDGNIGGQATSRRLASSLYFKNSEIT
jgi:hypothetical protein